MLYLYDKNTIDFTNNGEPIRHSYDEHVIREEGFYLTFKLLLDKNSDYKKVKKEMIVSAETPDGRNQFRVYDIVKRQDHVEVLAVQLMYDFDNKMVNPFKVSNVSGTTVINRFISAFKSSLGPFTLSSSVTETHDFATNDVDDDSPSHNALEVLNRITNRWDSELLLNGYDIRMVKRLGAKTNALLYEKKNISEFEDESSVRGMATRIHATSRFTAEGDEDETVISVTVDSPLINEYAQIYEKSFVNNDTRTTQELINWVKLKYSTENIDKPTRNIKVSTNIIDSTEINYGDELVLKYLIHDVDEVIRCVGYDYNPVAQTYYSITLGDWKDSFATTLTGGIVDATQRQVNQIKKNVTHILMNADGYHRNAYGPEPVANPINGDVWYYFEWDRPNEIEIRIFEDGFWVPIPFATTAEVEAALEEAESAKQAAEQSFTDAVTEAERLVTEQTEVFDSQMADVNQEINTVKTNIDDRLLLVNQDIANNFTSLSDSISTVSDISNQAKTDAQTALSNASTALGQAQSAVSTAASTNNKAIKSSVVDWALSASGTTPPTSGWQTSIPTPSSTQYTWGRTTITLNDGTTILSYNVSKIGVKGDKGDTGAKGDKGDTGAVGAKGDKGDAGVNAPKITAVKQQFYLSTSNTAQTGGSWTETIPVWSSGKYYWTRVVTSYDNATTTPSVAVLDNALNQSLVTALEAKSDTQTLSTTVSQHATQIAAKANQTTVDTLAGRVSTAEGSISVQAGEIALKASQTSVDTLAGRVGTAETSISNNTTAINLRATKSSVDTLTGRVSTAEGQISTQAGQIALRATTTTVNALAGRVSSAESALSIQSGKIDLAATKTELTTAIDGIEIGGRNLLLDSAELDNPIGGNAYSIRNKGLQAGKYTISFDYEVDPLGGEPTSFLLYTDRSITQVPIEKNESGRATHTFNLSETDAGKNINVYAGNGSAESRLNGVRFIELKLEKGNKATDWTPAPEDVDASIASVQSNLTVEAGKITALTTRVGTTETNISNVTQTVSGINTTISTLRTDVDGKATIVSLNQVKSTADGNKTTISNHAGRLTTVETNVNGLQTTVADKADKSQITQLTTSISTKVESATYNSKMTQLDNAINLRVVQGDITAAILADKRIKDTRTTNELPSWYFTNYKSQRVEEFKSRTVMGVPGSATYVKLVTDVPWSDGSGGVVVQTAYSSDGIYNRSGNSAGTAWGVWVKQTDSANVLAQVNLSTEGVLIQGKRIQLDGDVAMNAAYITRLNTQTLSAITANITSIRSQVLVTDSVTSTHIKADTALIDSLFATTALITRLTSKTAFINNIKAIEISADKVTTGTLNAANVNIINLNASQIVANNLSSLSSNTGNLYVSGNLTMLTANNGIIGYFDFFETDAYNPRRFAGNMNVSLNSVSYKGDVFRNEPNNTGHLGYCLSEYGLDFFKHRVYDNHNSMQLNYRIDMYRGRIEVSNGWAILDDKTTVITGGVVQTGTLLGKMGVTTPRINLPDAYNTFQINETWARGIPRLTLSNGHFGFGIDTTSSAFAQMNVGSDDTNTARVWFVRGVYERTYSDSANMYVTGSGTIGRAVSARKYKEDIRTLDLPNAKAVLDVNPSSWIDKADIKKGRQNIRYYGFIADDFDEAGLTEVVKYGLDGQVEGLAYDRISMYHNIILRDHETDITRINTFVSQHDIEINNLKEENEMLRHKIQILEEKIA